MTRFDLDLEKTCAAHGCENPVSANPLAVYCCDKCRRDTRRGTASGSNKDDEDEAPDYMVEVNGKEVFWWQVLDEMGVDLSPRALQIVKVVNLADEKRPGKYKKEV